MNRMYSKEFKIKGVLTVMNGKGSVDDIIARYGISSHSVLRQWIKVHNANRELKDYNPKREIYMAEARRKTSYGKGVSSGLSFLHNHIVEKFINIW